MGCGVQEESKGPESKGVIWKELTKLGEIKKESFHNVFASGMQEMHARNALF